MKERELISRSRNLPEQKIFSWPNLMFVHWAPPTKGCSHLALICHYSNILEMTLQETWNFINTMLHSLGYFTLDALDINSVRHFNIPLVRCDDSRWTFFVSRTCSCSGTIAIGFVVVDATFEPCIRMIPNIIHINLSNTWFDRMSDFKMFQTC